MRLGTPAILLMLTALLSCGAPATPAPAAPDATGWDDLAAAVVDRLATGDLVAAAKWRTRGPIEDAAREQVVLDAAAAGAGQRGLDPERVEAVFGDQIAASKVVQYGLFASWTADPDASPPPADLAALRPQLDTITARLLDDLGSTAADRGAPTCDRAWHDAADRAARGARLDALHRMALDRAGRSLCGTGS
ncbi:MAG: chorismate mutase [Pseudonocardia sp.]